MYLRQIQVVLWAFYLSSVPSEREVQMVGDNGKKPSYELQYDIPSVHDLSRAMELSQAQLSPKGKMNLCTEAARRTNLPSCKLLDGWLTEPDRGPMSYRAHKSGNETFWRVPQGDGNQKPFVFLTAAVREEIQTASTHFCSFPS